ncbi:MAG: FtsK/SpoIIIE domain-containing protein [Planctomycetota bacterium]|nr:FtsK/SpoIIIE domain-containing protein [Planctomycetota bacterium]
MPGEAAIERVKHLIQTLFDGIAQRVEGELGLEQRIQRELAEVQVRYQATTVERRRAYEIERDALQAQYDRVCADAGVEYQAHYSAASEEYDEALRAANEDFEDIADQIRHDFEETRWMVVSYFDENAGGSPKQQFEQFENNVAKSREHVDGVCSELEALHDSTVTTLKNRRMWSESDLPAHSPLPQSLEGMLENFEEYAGQSRMQSARLKRQKLPLLFSGLVPVFYFLAMVVGLTVTAWFVVDPGWLRFQTIPPVQEWLAILAGIAVVATMTIQGILFGVARSSAESGYARLAQNMVDLKAVRQQWSRLSTREFKRRKKEFDSWYSTLVRERDSRLRKAQEKFDNATNSHKGRRAQLLKQANDRYPALMESLTRDRDERLQNANDEFPGKLEKLKSRFDWDLKKLGQEHESSLEAIRQQYDFDWQNMARCWHGVVETVRTTSDRMCSESARLSQRWPDLAFGNWTPATTIPAGIRLGDFQLRLDDIEYGIPEDDRLVPDANEFLVPAMLPFPDKASLLLKASGGEGREASVGLLQVVMLRLLATLPPGKVRFTIIDPIGLGENFSAFMHLVDYDELLVTSRIWTEVPHIEQRLTDLTEHMETVFQTYLRNEFKTIEEYNDFAGEVAEPYHILVIAGFPSSFSEQAARRLTSIMSSGPRCGVYTLLSVDPQLSMPPNFSLVDAAYEATCLTWSDGAFSFDDEDVAWLPLQIHEPPEPDEFSRFVKRVGEESKDARRVEVSFERVVPKDLWQLDSRSGLDVPLGRAGATKLQHMRLGKGTSQHVLIAGKTGSGKSTLMHILVTNLVLHYSPDEIEFYLIDFKKGVEFKTYATNRLPHARVIAIESDREFGLSVLQRLDGILKERGDLFRERGVQDIAGFRNNNLERMPRIMLLIDEFQEFFTEDDRISQQAALLMDRLVRQGRAFGMHVMLGSQTLGGAYSLARSTLGQVAVRIALQCSEADAHLILSEDNTAARLLTRPGEAIYNDANGLLEGNHPFQIAWLDDQKRDEHLQRVRQLTDEQGCIFPAPIVFEGNVPAVPTGNQELVALFDHDRSTDSTIAVEAWLGEAVAIKPHTEIGFRRLSGSNLLIVGQSPIGARGILSSVFLAAIGQVSPSLFLPHDALVLVDEAEDESENDETECGDTPAVSELPTAELSAADALESLKSFSFASMKIPNPVADSPNSSDDARGPRRPAAQFYILDGELADAPAVEFWSRLSEGLPHDIRIGGPNDAADFVSELAEVVESRGTSTSEPPVFLLVDNLGRFRDLRKSDDEYNFSADRSKVASPSKRFVQILKEGPSVGVHVLVWADTFSNASRWMTSQTMRELEMRVAFQMSATDSSNLIDSPVAGRLGQNRALLYLEETGTLEKFRPYGLPSDEWLATIRSSFQSDSEPTVGDETPDNGDDLEVCDDLSSWTVL